MKVDADAEAWVPPDGWAEFLATWVDYRYGKGISDRAWDDFQAGKGPYDE